MDGRSHWATPRMRPVAALPRQPGRTTIVVQAAATMASSYEVWGMLVTTISAPAASRIQQQGDGAHAGAVAAPRERPQQDSREQREGDVEQLHGDMPGAQARVGEGRRDGIAHGQLREAAGAREHAPGELVVLAQLTVTHAVIASRGGESDREQHDQPPVAMANPLTAAITGRQPGHHENGAQPGRDGEQRQEHGLDAGSTAGKVRSDRGQVDAQVDRRQDGDESQPERPADGDGRSQARQAAPIGGRLRLHRCLAA